MVILTEKGSLTDQGIQNPNQETLDNLHWSQSRVSLVWSFGIITGRLFTQDQITYILITRDMGHIEFTVSQIEEVSDLGGNGLVPKIELII